MDSPEFVVDFPTLGDLADGWMRQHCRVPDGFTRGKPFELADWQFWIAANRYRIREDSVFVPPEEVGPDNPPLLNQAFFYRSTLTIAPQKTGKGPMSAGFVAFEAAGPSVFGGWAVEGDVYRCEDHGCYCGWEYEYLPGEPMGIRHPSPLIQITGFSEDGADNVYRPLRAMIRLGPLKHLLAVREGFIRILGLSDDDDLDRIDVVTASANSRLGNPISDAEQDEVGLWTDANGMIGLADTQRRGAAGMGGRVHQTTNAPDQAMNSLAQQVLEAAEPDVFVFYRNPDVALAREDGTRLDYKVASDRRRIHEYVYRGSWWVDLNSIEAEASSLIQQGKLSQAERFFGNRIVQGEGAFLDEDLVLNRVSDVVVPDGAEVAGGMDGSVSNDWTAIRLETREGHRFTPTWGPNGKPAVWNPKTYPDGLIPRHEVVRAVADIFKRYKVRRFYIDPRFWETQADDWAAEHGEEVVVQWPTNMIGRMWPALTRYHTDLLQRETTHDACPHYRLHALAAVKLFRGPEKYFITKPAPHQKIDVLMSDVLAHEAAADQRAAGWPDDSGPTYFRLPR